MPVLKIIHSHLPVAKSDSELANPEIKTLSTMTMAVVHFKLHTNVYRKHNSLQLLFNSGPIREVFNHWS